MIKLLIDDRESSLIKELKELNERNDGHNTYTGIQDDITIKRLDLGDFIITQDDKIIVVIERKTLSDLVSSIKDGRYKSQKQRLLELKNKCPECKIIYLFEEFITFSTSNNFKQLMITSIKSAFINTIFRDDLTIVTTTDTNDSLNFLLYTLQQFKSCPEKYMKNKNVEMNIEMNIEMKSNQICLKKKKISHNDILLHQLACIPGIGLQQANSILKRFDNIHNMKDLINELEKNSKLLLDIKGVGVKTNNTILSMLGIIN
jgi:crossover junction endonuclease MUS81